ncbi:hypothetical protein CVT24_006026 [Panaeolus cyanescens]|uniref:Uncharacterized protein n=1 Tax=Panaeolus cyanescens TaxID=181874 RepID=A0A409YE17_9AGAR|nr:hypothetical protein CVT24_006026 [Panaeolus cyanescens]
MHSPVTFKEREAEADTTKAKDVAKITKIPWRERLNIDRGRLDLQLSFLHLLPKLYLYNFCSPDGDPKQRIVNAAPMEEDPQKMDTAILRRDGSTFEPMNSVVP